MTPRTLRWALLAILSGCQQRSGPEEAYHQAYRNYLQGNLQTADRQAEQGARRGSANSSSPWQWKFLLLRARVLLQRGQQDRVPSLLNSLASETSLEVTRKTILGSALTKLGKYDGAENTLAAAQKQATEAGLTALLPEIEVRKGTLYAKRSQDELAASTLRHAIDLGRRQDDLFSEAEALNQLGNMLLADGKPDQAIPLFEQALALTSRIGTPYFGQLFQDNLSICYGLIGEFEKAIAMRNQAVAFFKKSDAKSALQQSVGETGNLYLDKGEAGNAVPYFREAYQLAESIQKPTDACIWAGNLALAYIELGRWDEAETFNNKAAELQTTLNEMAPVEYTQLNAALIAAGRGRAEQAEVLYRHLISASGKNPEVLVQARAGYGALEASRSNWREARVHFEGAIQLIEQKRADLLFGDHKVDHKITFLARLIRFYQKYVALLVRQGDVQRALYIADSSRALALSETTDDQTNLPAKIVSPDYRQIARKWNVVLLSYWIAPDESYLWAISPGEVRFMKLAPFRDIAALVDAYKSSIERQISDPVQSNSATGHKLYEILVQPVADMVPPGSRVVLVADGPLHNLNFETVLTPGTPARYWIENATVAVAPSLRVLQSGPPSNTTSSKLLLIGDPEGHDPDGPKLQYANEELKSIEAQFTPGTYSVFAENRATPEVYRTTAANGYSMIHFSAHAIANHLSPLDSAILLSSSGGDYKLYARDIMSLPLRASLVTLSACRSAGARAYAGEGLVGFSWAFLHAGAHNVVAGLWDVSDRSTAEFMGKFYAQMKLGKEPVDALRATKLEFANSAKGFRKPYYWAPFQIYIRGRG